MESLSIKDDLNEKQVVAPGKSTILQTTLNVFLSGIRNLKQYEVYSTRTWNSIFQQQLFLHTDGYKGHHCWQRNMSLGNFFFNQKLETKQNILVYNLLMCNSCYFSLQPLLYLLRALMCAQLCTQKVLLKELVMEAICQGDQ